MGNTATEQMDTCSKEVMQVFIYLINYCPEKPCVKSDLEFPTLTTDERMTIYKNSITFFLLGSHSRLKVSNLRNADDNFLT